MVRARALRRFRCQRSAAKQLKKKARRVPSFDCNPICVFSLFIRGFCQVFRCFIDRFFDVGDLDLGVYLGRVEAVVAEQFLDVPEARPVAKQVGRAGVPEGVHRRLDPGRFRGVLYDAPYLRI